MGVQFRRPDSTQSWLRRISLIVLAIQMPTATSRMHASNPNPLLIMRWR